MRASALATGFMQVFKPQGSCHFINYCDIYLSALWPQDLCQYLKHGVHLSITMNDGCQLLRRMVSDGLLNTVISMSVF